MHRPALLLLLVASLSAAIAAHGQVPSAPLSKQEPVTQAQEPVSGQVAEAESAIANTDWKAAESKLDSWLAAHPHDARALFDAGYVADVQNRPDDAAGLYRRAIQADPDAFNAHLLLGILLARQGKLDEAHTELVRTTQLDAGDGGPELKARAWRALARIDRDSNPTEASNDLLEALKLSPETTEDTLMTADLAVRTGQFDAAEAEYRRVLAKDPNSETANAGLAHLLIKKKQYPEAETLLRTALQHAPDDPTLTAQLAGVLAAEDKAEALPMLQKLHEQHPSDTAVTRMLAEVLADAGDYAGADVLDVKLLVTSPNDSALLIAHGQNLVRQMKFAEAYSVFDKATQLDPSSVDGWSGLAFAASRIEKPQATLHALTMRARLQPENASTYFLWATAYDSLHERAQAAAYYHHFLDAAAGKFPNQEWQAKQRLQILEK